MTLQINHPRKVSTYIPIEIPLENRGKQLYYEIVSGSERLRQGRFQAAILNISVRSMPQNLLMTLRIHYNAELVHESQFEVVD